MSQEELQNMVETSYMINNRPSVVRFPRGSGYGAEILKDIIGSTNLKSTNELPPRGKVLPIGKGRIVKKGEVRHHAAAVRSVIRIQIFFSFSFLLLARWAPLGLTYWQIYQCHLKKLLLTTCHHFYVPIWYQINFVYAF
jgi:hypothetical protein